MGCSYGKPGGRLGNEERFGFCGDSARLEPLPSDVSLALVVSTRGEGGR